MGNDPAWYHRLSRKARDAWDQTGHFWMCLVISAIGSAAAAWAFVHWREFYQQWPIRRIEDTERDIRFGISGCVPGQIIFTIWTVAVAIKVAR